VFVVVMVVVLDKNILYIAKSALLASQPAREGVTFIDFHTQKHVQRCISNDCAKKKSLTL